MTAARVPLSRDQESGDSGSPGNDYVEFVPGQGDELRSMAFSQPQKAPAAVGSPARFSRMTVELSKTTRYSKRQLAAIA
jgi:hypothetical protein